MLNACNMPFIALLYYVIECLINGFLGHGLTMRSLINLASNHSGCMKNNFR
jgi:hypothetical protein